MPRLSFETQDEKKMYERGRNDALEELFKTWYAELRERGAFPDKDAEAFARWGTEVLLPEMNRHQGQDDLFERLKNI